MKTDIRYICLDTETTGTSISLGDRIIEIGCVEVVNGKETGKVYHTYINPECDVSQEAQTIHGITTSFLLDKPKFEEIKDDFISFISNSVLVIHNAPFDVAFLEQELKKYDYILTNEIIDTLTLARKKYPGERASLDALCKKFNIDSSWRKLHGAMTDATLLARVLLCFDVEMEIHTVHKKYITENKAIRSSYADLDFYVIEAPLPTVQS